MHVKWLVASSISITTLIIGFSIMYYLIIYIPKKDRELINAQLNNRQVRVVKDPPILVTPTSEIKITPVLPTTIVVTLVPDVTTSKYTEVIDSLRKERDCWGTAYKTEQKCTTERVLGCYDEKGSPQCAQVNNKCKDVKKDYSQEEKDAAITKLSAAIDELKVGILVDLGGLPRCPNNN